MLLSPLVKDPEFVREVAHPRDRVRGSAAAPARRPRSAAARADAGGVSRFGRHRIGGDPPRRSARARAPSAGLAPSKLSRAAGAVDGAPGRRATTSSDRLVSHPWAERLFERYQPAMLVVSSPGLIFSEVPLLRTAARRGVIAHGDRSELGQLHQQAAAGPPRRPAGGLERADEASRRSSCTATSPTRFAWRARRSGIATFATASRLSRDAFFRRIGADPARKLVTLTTTPRELYPHHDHVLRVLARAIADGRWPRRRRCWCACIRATTIEHYARVRGRAGRDHREAVPADRARRRRDGGRRHRRQPAAPGRHDAPQRRGRERRVDHRDRGGDLRHAGREYRVRRRNAVRSARGRRGAITRSRTTSTSRGTTRVRDRRTPEQLIEQVGDAISNIRRSIARAAARSCSSSASSSTAAPPSASPDSSSRSSPASPAASCRPSCVALQASSR